MDGADIPILRWWGWGSALFKQRKATAYCVIGRGKEYHGALPAGIKNPRGFRCGVEGLLNCFRGFVRGGGRFFQGFKALKGALTEMVFRAEHPTHVRDEIGMKGSFFQIKGE